MSSASADPLAIQSSSSDNINHNTKSAVKSGQRDRRRASRRKSMPLAATAWLRVQSQSQRKQQEPRIPEIIETEGEFSSGSSVTSSKSFANVKRIPRRNSTGMNKSTQLEQTKYLVTCAITEKEQKVKEMQKLIDHTEAGVEARMESKNLIGAVIFMKLILKYEAQRDQALSCIAKLNQILVDMNKRNDTVFSDYGNYVRDIMAQPASIPKLETEAQILAEIGSRLRAKKVLASQDCVMKENGSSE